MKSKRSKKPRKSKACGSARPGKGEAVEARLAWPDDQVLRNSRVWITISRMVQDARILAEVEKQVWRLSLDEFRVLNSLSPRDFDEIVHGSIFDAGEKVKFWERYQECETWGRREMRSVSKKIRDRISALLEKDLSSKDYRSLNQLPDSAFWRAIQHLFEVLAEQGAMRLPDGAVADAIGRATGP